MERAEYWIRSGHRKAIALIHGIGAKDPQVYWQDFLSVLMQDKELDEFGVFVWKYPTHVQPSSIWNPFSTIKRKTLREAAPRIALLGSAWKTTYHTQFQGYQDIVLVCHSMGGLVVKSWILDTLEQGQSMSLATLRHIAFYATPHQGAPITTLAEWNKQLKDMQLDSSFIEDVDRRWYDHVVAWKERIPEPVDERFNCYIPHVVLAGLNDGVVPSRFATIRGMRLTLIHGDHSEVIQPIDSNDTRYKVWRTHLNEMFKMTVPKADASSPPDQQMPHAIDEEKNQTVYHPVPARPSGQSRSAHFPALQNPVNVFISYVKEDEPLFQKLETHLSMLKWQGLISTWDARQIVPGTNRAEVINEQFKHASIIVLLVSADFLASDYYYQVEMKHALERHEASQARVLSIIVRPCDWSHAPFARLQYLPHNGKAVTIWDNQDLAWSDVIIGIRQTIEDLHRGNSAAHQEAGSESKPGLSPDRSSDTAQRSDLSLLTAPLRDTSSPEVWNVSRRHNTFFTGRTYVLQQLADGFRVESGKETAPPQAITGLAGMGKTQTAAEYAYRFRQDYRYVLWARAQTQEDLVTDFKTIARLLKLPQEHLEDREILMQTLQEWFRNEEGWLLIFDNADDFALVEPFIPPMGPGHVLLTTRVGATVEVAQALELQALTVEDGALCLLRRAGLLRWNKQVKDAPPAYADAARELAREMNGLPLALEQAGAYINDTKCGVKRYLELYRLYRPKLQQIQSGMVPDYAVPVAFALMISSKLIGRTSAAFELLQLCAFLAPEGIPDQFVTLAATALGPALSSIANDPVALDQQAIRPLVRYSLLGREEQSGTAFTTLSIHRILQLVLLDEMDVPTRQLWAERAVRALIQALQTMPWSVLQAHARQCLDHIARWHLSVPEVEIIQTYR